MTKAQALDISIAESNIRRWQRLVIAMTLVFSAVLILAQRERRALAEATFDSRSTQDGLGSNSLYDVHSNASNIYAATSGGLSISNDNGATWTNKTTANGLGGITVYGVHSNASNIYAATSGGLSISNDNGATWTNYTTANGLGSNWVSDAFSVDAIILAATIGGLSMSNDNGATWTNYTTANGLRNNRVNTVYRHQSSIYAGTSAGLSISNDNGATWTNYTTANGLGNNWITDILLDESAAYITTAGGLSVSNDNGATWTNYTTANGLGNNRTNGVQKVGTALFVATTNGLGISRASATPFISEQPSSVTFTNGETVTLRVVATSSDNGVLTYQWRKDGLIVTGATLPTHVISNASSIHSGSYTVDVTNTLFFGGNTVTSSVATLTVVASTLTSQTPSEPGTTIPVEMPSPSLSVQAVPNATTKPLRPTQVRAVVSKDVITLHFTRVRGLTYEAVAARGTSRRVLICRSSAMTTNCKTGKISNGRWTVTLTPRKGLVKGDAFKKTVSVP